jgi:predicted nicotinamide N-methyase
MLLNDFAHLPPADAGKLHELAQSVETFQLLASVLQWGFFDALETPKDAEELAEELGLNRVITRKCCDALAGSGYLLHREGRYALSDLSKTFLLKSSPYYQGDLIGLLKKTRIERWGRISEALESGPVGFGRNFESVFDASFIHAMAQGAVRGSLQKTIEILRGHQEFMNARRLLDLGGGHALYSIAFAQLNPSLDVRVLDLPPVVEAVTRQNISAYQADRVTAAPGDFTQDDLGEGYDVVFASDVLYRPRESLGSILDRIHSSLNDNGLFISKHWHIDDPVKDITAVYFDLMFSITEEAERIYSTEEFSKLLESHGFSIEEAHSFGHQFHPSRMIIARKVKT